jgi:hypothetical protein
MTRHALIENTSRAVSFAVLGAFGAWMLVAWAWPLCGPWLVAPCPLATPLGAKVALGVGALWGLVKAVALELAARQRFVPPLPRERRVSRPMAVVGCATRVDPADSKHTPRARKVTP